MKKLLLSLLISLPTLINAQPVDGFGKIKLGKTYDQLLSDIDVNPKKIVSSKNEKLSFSEVYRPRKATLVIYDSAHFQESLKYSYVMCESAKLLLLPSYKVSDIEVNNLELKFFNDTLYSIQITNPTSDFTTAFKLKYGSGKTETEKKTVQCSNALTGAGKFEVEEVAYTTTWSGEPDDIRAYSRLSDYRDSECKHQYISYYLISYDPTSTIVSQCERATKDIIKKRTEAQMKAKIKDF
ncbi:MAG TPA: hypothetical protein VGP43_02520 [Chitinophagaceae bacterium]|nr:hypothetical protein [Chitinophagaceae bacterium]